MTFSQRRTPDGTALASKDISIQAFGRLEPQSDPDAAAKFALAEIGSGRGRRMSSLIHLLTEGDRIGGLEGDPGWTLERPDDRNIMPGFANWPPGVKYRARVDPAGYHLANPEKFYDRASFHLLVTRLLDAFERLHPEQGNVIRSVRAVL